MTVLAEAYDVALLDLDGVVYVGSHAVPHAREALADSRAAGMRLAFVTNNAARPPQVVADHLTDLGVAADPSEVVTSAQAAARLLAEQIPAGSEVLVVGGDGLYDALVEQGLVGRAELGPATAAVVQGFHPDVGWRLLAEGAYAVNAGLPWVASNTDRTIPTPRGRAPGNGTLVDVVRQATGRAPVVAGKPEPPMHREAVLRSGASRPLVVGDRLDTDIEGAHRGGVDSLLVFTGVTDPVEVIRADEAHRPTYLGEDLRSLLAPTGELDVSAGQVTTPTWSASVAGGDVVLEPVRDAPTSKLDAVRALCGLCWARPDARELSGVASALTKAGW